MEKRKLYNNMAVPEKSLTLTGQLKPKRSPSQLRGLGNMTSVNFTNSLRTNPNIIVSTKTPKNSETNQIIRPKYMLNKSHQRNTTRTSIKKTDLNATTIDALVNTPRSYNKYINKEILKSSSKELKSKYKPQFKLYLLGNENLKQSKAWLQHLRKTALRGNRYGRYEKNIQYLEKPVPNSKFITAIQHSYRNAQ